MKKKPKQIPFLAEHLRAFNAPPPKGRTERFQSFLDSLPADRATPARKRTLKVAFRGRPAK